MNKDLMSKSDPILQIMLEGPSGFTEVGRTECVKASRVPHRFFVARTLTHLARQDNLNPQFTKSLTMEFYFEMRQTLRIVCYDMDNPRLPLEKQDYIGARVCAGRGCVARALMIPFRRAHI